MKYMRYQIHVVMVLILGLCAPCVVSAETNNKSEEQIRELPRPEIQLGRIQSSNTRLYTLMNNELFQRRLLAAHSAYSQTDRQSALPIRLVALDSVDGPPPCGKDGYCNLNACSADPDCPDGLQQERDSEPYEPPHNDKGIGGSVWLTTGHDGFEGGHSCDFDKGTCNIKVWWSVQPDKYDKWKICWKDWGDTFTNACDENQKVRKFENNFYVIPNLKEDHHYRIRLEGRKDKNDKWKCLVKARLRNVHLNGTNIRGVVPCIVP
ncbi:MAG: hypothetical protein NPIRA04_16310 [Nitrospirales bacterium]|nr:MAG: hypothetical protein NPIRA04_16310 [Nitrospirales bacterium]